MKGTSIEIYLDGRRVAQVSNDRSTGPVTPGVYLNGKSGALHIESVRYYATP